MKIKLFISLSLFTFVISSCSDNMEQDCSSGISPVKFNINFAKNNITNTRACSALKDTVHIMKGFYKPVYLFTSSLRNQERDIKHANFSTNKDTIFSTRGSQLNSINNLSNFGISATEYTSDQELSSNSPNYLQNEKVYYTGYTWRTSALHPMPASNHKVSFFAYSPYENDNVVYLNGILGNQYVSYNADVSPLQQPDLITALTTGVESSTVKNSVNLNFNHALTAVKFITGTSFPLCTITSIKFKDIILDGKKYIGGDWFDLGKNKDYIFNIEKTMTGNSEEQITSQDQTMMMIPQSFTSDTQKLEINIKYSNNNYTFSSPLKGTSWEEGKVVTYVISMKIDDPSVKLFYDDGSTKKIYGLSSISKEAIDNPDNVTKIKTGSSLKSIAASCFCGLQKLKEVDLSMTPNGLTVSRNSFQNCYNLEKVTFPSEISEVVGDAFRNDYALKSMAINQTSSSFAGWCFANCTSLEEVQLSGSIQKIWDGAFSGCNSLKTLTLPATLKSICKETFDGCTSLKEIHFNGSIAQWKNITKDCSFNGKVICSDGTTNFF